MGKRKVCAELEDDLPDVVEPLGDAVDSLGEELFSARTLLDEGALRVAGEFEQEGGDLRLFSLEVQSGHGCVLAVHVARGEEDPLPPEPWRGVEEGREMSLYEELLCVGWQGIVEMEEPGRRVHEYQ